MLIRHNNKSQNSFLDWRVAFIPWMYSTFDLIIESVATWLDNPSAASSVFRMIWTGAATVFQYRWLTSTWLHISTKPGDESSSWLGLFRSAVGLATLLSICFDLASVSSELLPCLGCHHVWSVFWRTEPGIHVLVSWSRIRIFCPGSRLVSSLPGTRRWFLVSTWRMKGS